MQDKKYKSVVQETLITQRNGRYVIPVRSEAQSTIKGIVQEQSQSGATVYLEPYTIVEDNNKLSRKFSEEKNEVDRILYELGLEILPDADFLLASTDEMAKIDSIIAKAFLLYGNKSNEA
jgi:DNA mismatch repair protein MutS2